jgi:hypothetical protein
MFGKEIKDKGSTSFALIEEMETTQASHLKWKMSHQHQSLDICVWGGDNNPTTNSCLEKKQKRVLGPKPLQ